MNCAAPSGLIESELFGHERGAFTGAQLRRPGRFELAHTGTLFLDEIGEMPMETQAKLLRVLQDGMVDRIGGTQPLAVDVRVIAATNADLSAAIRQGTFRADLYYRLHIFPSRSRRFGNVVRTSPPCAAFSRADRHQAQTPPSHFRPAVDGPLVDLQLAGNVRELQNVIERAIILSHSSRVTVGRCCFRLQRLLSTCMAARP